jgi:putative CocE/NonD family hydrolase
MQVRDFHQTVETIELSWIPMPDGRKLALRLFLPKNRQGPLPAILEYIPYRRRDGTRLGDDEMHIWFAAHGYVAARVDISGMGDSEGLVEDEYVRREQDDALTVIEWLGTQVWSSGNVGMIGISWGGFNGLQVAARRPPRLKAVITMCSTDDRYACDAHYLGGCLLNDNFSWGGAFFNYAAQPPDPLMVGEENWRAMWRQRVINHVNFPANWLHHQRRDEFWKHGSICEDYAAIECPVFAVGGWLDGYTPTILRLVENLQAPCKGLIGPWGHKEPQRGVPGPAIGFLQECLRWWDQYLKGENRGIENDPAMRLWLQDYAAPQPHFSQRPGRWLGFPKWPTSKFTKLSLYPQGAALDSHPARQKQTLLSISSPQTTGLKAQEWCPYGQGRISAESATDQREDDGGSLCFDGTPLSKPIRIVGECRVHLRIAADQSQAMVALRLCDVAPDGTSALITFGMLNLSHRESHEFPSALKPGKFYDIVVVLKPIAQIVPRGHRIRLAVSSSYWPMTWPSPEIVTLRLDTAKSRIELPVLETTAGLTGVAFEAAEYAKSGSVTVIVPAKETRELYFDVETQQQYFDIKSDDGRYIIDDTGTEVASNRNKVYEIGRSDPSSVKTTVTCSQEFRRGSWNARVETEVIVTSDQTHFHITATVKTFDNDSPFESLNFDETIPRDHL